MKQKPLGGREGVKFEWILMILVKWMFVSRKPKEWLNVSFFKIAVRESIDLGHFWTFVFAAVVIGALNGHITPGKASEVGAWDKNTKGGKLLSPHFDSKTWPFPILETLVSSYFTNATKLMIQISLSFDVLHEWGLKKLSNGGDMRWISEPGLK